MEIFQFKAEDALLYADTITRLIKNSFTNSFPNQTVNDDYFFERPRLLNSYINDNKAVAFGVKDDSRLIGFVWCYVQENLTEKVLHVVHYAVDENKRGGGIGKTLLDCCEAYAKEHGICAVEGIVTATNKNAVAVCERLGYKTVRYHVRKDVV